MWTRLTRSHRRAAYTAATFHRRRALLVTHSANLYPLASSMSTMSTAALPTSKPSNLPSQLTALCMSHTHFQAFQGNPLNKLHLHRKDERHIESLQSHPSARFLVLNTRLQPLLRTLPALPAAPTTATSASPTAPLASIRTPLSTRAVITWLTAEQLSTVLSQSPIVVLLGQVDNEAPIAATVTSSGELVETGVHSQSVAVNDGSLEEDAPYHAVLLQSEAQSSQLIASLPNTADSSYAHHDLRLSLPSLNYTDASILAQARALLEWHQSSLYCGRCGSHTQSLEGGAKRQCTAPPPLKTRSSTVPILRQPEQQCSGHVLRPHTVSSHRLCHNHSDSIQRRQPRTARSKERVPSRSVHVSGWLPGGRRDAGGGSEARSVGGERSVCERSPLLRVAAVAVLRRPVDGRLLRSGRPSHHAEQDQASPTE